MSADLLLAVEPDRDPELAALLSEVPGARVVRRCVDVADLLGVAEAGLGDVAVVSATLRDLDGECIRALRSVGVGVVGVHVEGDEPAQRRLAQWGITATAAYTAPAREWAETLARAPHQEESGEQPVEDPGGEVGPAEQAGRGRVVAVWGPPGAPGRSTLALELAASLAGDRDVLLVDADSHAPGLAQQLALLDDVSGLVAAARAADEGRLDVPVLAQCARGIDRGLRVLTGIGRADRWPEVRSGALEAVVLAARQLVDVVVLDVHSSLEDDEVLSYDTRSPRRNALTLTALAEADLVVVVGGADAVALQRLVRGVDALDLAVPGAPQLVVLNHVRRSAAREGELQETAERHLSRAVAALLPEDRPAVDRALLTGEPAVWSSPRSTLARRVAALAREVGAQLDAAGAPEPAAVPR